MERFYSPNPMELFQENLMGPNYGASGDVFFGAVIWFYEGRGMKNGSSTQRATALPLYFVNQPINKILILC